VPGYRQSASAASRVSTRRSFRYALPRRAAVSGRQPLRSSGYFSTYRELGRICNVTWVAVSLAYEADSVWPPNAPDGPCAARRTPVPGPSSTRTWWSPCASALLTGRGRCRNALRLEPGVADERSHVRAGLYVAGRAIECDCRHAGEIPIRGSGAAWLAGTVTRCDNRSLVRQRRASPNDVASGWVCCPARGPGDQPRRRRCGRDLRRRKRHDSGLVVLIGRAAPALFLALLKVLRTVNAGWIIAGSQNASR